MMDGSSFLAAFAGGAADGKSMKASAQTSSSEEVIHFNGILGSFPVKGKEVLILARPGDHDVGSSKLKISNIVDYGWEHSYYPGHLVATHNSGDWFAYGIYAAAKGTGVVRVVYRKTQDRVLLKGMKGRIEDLAFSHCRDKIYLAVIDSAGTLFVFNVWMEAGNLQTNLMLEVRGSKAQGAEGIHRVIWCPFLPDEDDIDDEDDSNSRLLVHINGCVADMWNVDAVLAKQGGGPGPYEADDITEGQLRITDHTEPISDASFSPDGTALATASLDGQVKFFQVYMLGSKESPRCLHHWRPHDGRPVSSLFFLDNHRNYNPDVQFWKFAVTGADHNSEIKVWSCESWDCIQTIRFEPSPTTTQPMMFKAALDLSARYLLLSNIYQKTVYVLQLQPDKEDKASADPDKPAHVTVVSVSEFATPTPFLSLSISEAGKLNELAAKKARKRANTDDTSTMDDDSDDDDSCSDDSDVEDLDSTAIKFILVNPKSLQECKIAYNDAYDIKQYSNGVKREPFEVEQEVVVKSEPVHIKKEPEVEANGDKSLPLSEAAKKITLMSPEVFVTSGSAGSASGSASKKVKTEIKEESVAVVKTEPLQHPTTGQLLISSILASGGSSPSREVRNILAESEEHGGMLNDVVITEETDDEEEDEEEEVAEDEDYNEDAEFEGLEEKLAAAASAKPTAVKQEIKQEVIDEDDDDDSDEEELDPLSNLIKNHLNISTASNKSSQEVASQQNQAWQTLVAKQETPSSPPPVNRSFEVKTELPAAPAAQPGPLAFAAVSSPVALAPAAQQQQQQPVEVAQINQQLAAMSKAMTEMVQMQMAMREMIQMQRSEIKALREEGARAGAQSKADAQAALTRAVKDQTDSVTQKLDAAVKREMKKVSGDLTKTTTHALQQHLRTEVNKCDNALRDAVAKMAHSKAVTENLGVALAQTLAPVLQASFRDVFASVLTPAFERALQNMLQNLGQTFTKGAKDYDAVLRKEVHTLTQSVEDAVRNLEKSRGNQTGEMERALSNFQETILQEIRENARAQRSLSATPVSGATPGSVSGSLTPAEAAKETKKEIVSILREGKFNDAFQMALSARDLDLVVSTCEMVNPTQIFSQDNCPLDQSVLLSLIQQLGSKLYDKTEIKLKYLEESVTHLDTSDPGMEAGITRHVLNTLMVQLQDYYTKHPQQKFSKRMKYLWMATGFTLQQGSTAASPSNAAPVTDLTF